MFELIIAAAVGGLITSLGFGSFFFAKVNLGKRNMKLPELVNNVSNDSEKKEITVSETVGDTGFHSYEHFVSVIEKMMNGSDYNLSSIAKKIYGKLMNGYKNSNNQTIEDLIINYGRSMFSTRYYDNRTIFSLISDILPNIIEVKIGRDKKKFLIGQNGENIDSIIEDYLEYSEIFNKINELEKDMEKYSHVKNPDQEIIKSVNDKISEGQEKLNSIKKKINLGVENSRNFKETEQGLELYNKSLSTVF